MFAVLSLVVLGQGAPAPFTPGFNGLSWDPVITDIFGNALPPATKYEVAISLRTTDLMASGVPLKSIQLSVPNLDAQAGITLTTGLAVGDYRVWIRGLTPSGITSAASWSDPFLVNISFPYGKVTGIKVITFQNNSTIIIVPPGGTP